MNPVLYEELTFSWKRKIENKIEHKIQKKSSWTSIKLLLDSKLRTNLHLLRKEFILYPSQMLTINVKLQLLSALTLLVIFYQYSWSMEVLLINAIQKSNFQSRFVPPIVKIIGLTKILLWST